MSTTQETAAWTAVDTERLRELVADEDARQWQIGDLLLQRLPKGPAGRHTGVMAQLREVAAVVGAEPASLRVYRDVAYSWPAATRVAAATWSAHRAYQGSPDSAPDRAITLGTLPRNEHGYITKQAVRDLTRGASGTPNWAEAIGRVGDDLVRGRKDMDRFERLLDGKQPTQKVQDNAERYAEWAEELATRLRAVGGGDG